MEKHCNGKVITTAITELSRCEVFVYGTDMNGRRVGRAEQLAQAKFGAQPGQAGPQFGPQGQCYAIPVDVNNLQKMQPYVDEFIDYVKEHPDNRFLITRLGCGNGLIDYRDNRIAPMFDELYPLPNVIVSREWRTILMFNHQLPDKPAAPEVVDEEVLKELCHKYRYQIGANCVASLPDIRVRYVIGKDKFGYTSFGNFFFFGCNMYVFPKNAAVPEDNSVPVPTIVYNTKKMADDVKHIVPERFRIQFVDGRARIYTRDEYRKMLADLDDESLLKKLNSQKGSPNSRQLAYEEAAHRGIPEDAIDVSGTLQKKWNELEKKRDEDNSARGCVMDYFHDECWNRQTPQKVIFAGVQTPFKDVNGDWIYTGDVIKVEGGVSEEYLAVGAMCDEMGDGHYCFILDNHNWPLADCQQHCKLTRMGTVFYQLKEDDFRNVNQRTAGEKGFTGQRDTKEDKQQKVLMAKFTPNFKQDFWEYKMLDVLGAEFDWRKPTDI